jgi:hypothetical protein
LQCPGISSIHGMEASLCGTRTNLIWTVLTRLGGEAKRGLGDWAKDAIPGSAGYAKLVIEVRDEAGHVVFRGAVSFECTDE